MVKENIKSVGADASVRPSSKARQNKGITLIALVITIIVMLILVAVTINMAVNGGLFDYAGKAVGETQNAIDKEQELGSGKITIGETTYNSIDEYIDGTNEKTYVEITALSVGDYISGYPVEYENVSSYDTDSYYPADKFENKWRVLSTTGGVVRIVSAGVPLSYYHEYSDGAAATSVANLTTGFLTTEINSSTATECKFYKCGFDIGTSTNLSNVFTNNFTDKVQSLTKDDVDEVIGSISSNSTYVNGEEYGELLALPCKDGTSEYAWTWLASKVDSDDMTLWYVYSGGYVYFRQFGNVLGVRPVVTLNSNVKFSEATTKINDTTTWDISI